jgi:ribosomal-protein-serine acetyltransferase
MNAETTTDLVTEIPIEDGFCLKVRQLDDADAFFEVIDRNRTHLRAWLPWVDETAGVEMTRTYIQNCIENIKKRGGYDFGIFFNNTWVGSIGLHDLNRMNKRAAIGYWLDKDHEGKGLMTRATRALINFSFDELHLNRLVIMAAVENKKSRAIPERLEFSQEGVCRSYEWLYDHFVDSMQYSLLRGEWDAKRGS